MTSPRPRSSRSTAGARSGRAVAGVPRARDLLHARGIAGGTVLLGVDGTVRGDRRRARFFARNAEVPLMVVSFGSGERMAAVLREVGELLEHPLMTLERITVCKRDGERLAELAELSESDERGLELWQKLMVYAGEQNRVEDRPLYIELIRRLREAGASGATALRGIWGYTATTRLTATGLWACAGGCRS